MTSVAAFRAEDRDWLKADLAGEFARLRGCGGPGREHEALADALGRVAPIGERLLGPTLLALGPHRQRLFLFSHSDTAYAGADEIQRTVIAEPVLGPPREPRP